MRNITKISIIAIGLLFLPIVSFGQTSFTASSLPNELGVEIVPNYPSPNQNVSISLTLYTDDLNSADITWYKDGKNVLSGKGATKYSFKMGGAGTETDIEIKIKLLSGASFSKSFTLGGAGVDLVWEASSYVPPFYKGKSLHSIQGALKIVAIPEFIKNGKRVAPQNLIYEWSNGSSVYESQSGYGRNTILINGSLLGRNEEIAVLVRDPLTNLVANNFITITPGNPEIVFYENSSYYGQIYDTAIKNSLDMTSGEVQLTASPYYFSKEGSGKIKYNWKLNNTTVPGLTNSRTAIFKKPEGESGRSNISLEIENLNRILQRVSGNIIMNFENQDE